VGADVLAKSIATGREERIHPEEMEPSPFQGHQKLYFRSLPYCSEEREGLILFSTSSTATLLPAPPVS
jgi:hypothetical protein